MPDQVFIGYNAQFDRPFARQLARWLRGAGFDPWIDEERIPSGSDFEYHIRDALSDCKHGVFLVSKPWLDGDWTRYELETFARIDSTRRRIAVLRFLEGQHQLTPRLQCLQFVQWPGFRINAGDRQDAPPHGWLRVDSAFLDERAGDLRPADVRLFFDGEDPDVAIALRAIVCSKTGKRGKN